VTKPRKIELHSGHWVVGTGARDLIDEVTEARKVGRRVYEILKENGVPTTYFEDNTSKNQRQNLNTLVKHHNKDRDGLVVSIHFNASGGTVDRAIGTEVLYYDQQKLASDLSNAIAKAGGFINRGAKKRTNLAVLAQTYEPAVLLEVCFVNSKKDVELYRKNFEEICFSIAEVLAKHIGYSISKAKKDIKKEVPKPKKTVDKDVNELEFVSPTLKERFEMRVVSPATKELLVEKAIEVLGYKKEYWMPKYKANQIKEGDYITMAYELAVHYAKYHKC